jgi:arginase family enzyme
MSQRRAAWRNLVLAGALPAVLALQRLAPDRQEPAPLGVAGSPAATLPPVEILSASGLPGVAELVATLPVASRPLGLDPAWAVRAAASYPSSAEARPFPPPPRPSRPLVLGGHGQFHHLTYFVLRDYVEPLGLDYGVVSFDGHDDARAWEGPELDSQNWVGTALERLTRLRRVVEVGMALGLFEEEGRWLTPSGFPAGRLDFFPAVTQSLFGLEKPDPRTRLRGLRRDVASALQGRDGWQLELPRFDEGVDLASRVGATHVYVTIDMSVLAPEECGALGGDSGLLTVDEVLAAVRSLARARPLLGADLCGYPPARHDLGGPRFDPARCATSYRRLAEGLREALQAAPAEEGR